MLRDSLYKYVIRIRKMGFTLILRNPHVQRKKVSFRAMTSDQAIHNRVSVSLNLLLVTTTAQKTGGCRGSECFPMRQFFEIGGNSTNAIICPCRLDLSSASTGLTALG
jgi:hypothetical protein